MDDKALFGKLCEQALANQYNKEMLLCKEDAKCSASHYRKMSEILGYRVKGNSHFSKRVIAAILVAAMLLLVGCAVYVYRDKLSGLIAEIHEKYIKVISDEENNENMQNRPIEIYSLGYVPEGYIKVEESLSQRLVYYKWQNDVGDTISFSQEPTINMFIDGEHGYSEIMNIDNMELYHCSTSQSHYYIWSDGRYFMELLFNAEIQEDELIRIIDGLEIQE